MAMATKLKITSPSSIHPPLGAMTNCKHTKLKQKQKYRYNNHHHRYYNNNFNGHQHLLLYELKNTNPHTPRQLKQ